MLVFPQMDPQTFPQKIWPNGSPFLLLMGTLLRWDWHPDHSGYSEASLPANGPDPAAATGTLLSLVSSWRMQLARVPWPVRNKRLYWPFSTSLSLFPLLSPSYPSVFLVPQSWMHKFKKPLNFLFLSTVYKLVNLIL